MIDDFAIGPKRDPVGESSGDANGCGRAAWRTKQGGRTFAWEETSQIVRIGASAMPHRATHAPLGQQPFKLFLVTLHWLSKFGLF